MRERKMKIKVNSGGVANHTEFESKCYIPICLFVCFYLCVCVFLFRKIKERSLRLQMLR